MRLRLVVAESRKNFLSRPFLSFVLILISIATSVFVFYISFLEATRIEETRNTQIELGSNAFLVTAPTGQEFTANKCATLETVEGVIAAGARLSSASDTLLPVRYVTSGFIRAIDQNALPGSAVAAGRLLAESQHIIAGSKLHLFNDSSSLIKVDHIFGDSLRDTRANVEVLLVQPAASQPVHECVIESFGHTRLGIERLLSTWFLPSKVDIAPFIQPHDRIDLQRMVDARISPAASVLLPIFAVAIVFTSVLARRSDYSFYRLLGADWRDILHLLTFDLLWSLLLPYTITSTWLFTFTNAFFNNTVFEQTFLSVATSFSLLFLAVPLATLALLQSNPYTLLKRGS